MTRVNVRFLGPAADLADTPQQAYELAAGATLGQLLGRVVEEHPRLGPLLGARLAVNRRYVALDHVLADGDEVALVPPVSGG